MPSSTYIGATAYILENVANNEKLHLLASAIDALKNPLQDREVNIETWRKTCEKYKDLADSHAFQNLKNQNFLSWITEMELPIHTPTPLHQASIESAIFGPRERLKLYIPACGQGDARVSTYIHVSLRTVLEDLFGKDLAWLKIRKGYTSMRFIHTVQKTLINIPQIA